TRVPSTTAYLPASGGTSPVPAYTRKTELHPRGGGCEVACQPVTRKSTPSKWMEIVCAAAIIPPKKRMIATAAGISFRSGVTVYGNAIVCKLIGAAGGPGAHAC